MNLEHKMQLFQDVGKCKAPIKGVNDYPDDGANENINDRKEEKNEKEKCCVIFIINGNNYVMCM